MAILIDTIRIAGFRGIKNLEIQLPRITVLIGTNNSGKTSVLKAMQLALGDYSRHVSDEDFYIDANEMRVNEILVDVRIIAVDDNQQRKQLFDDEWIREFGDKIQSEANGFQFLALRTRCKHSVKERFETLRYTLNGWSNTVFWQAAGSVKETKLASRFQSLSFIGIEAQRDIHQELKEKSSFSGKVLSEVSSTYNADEVKALEELIKEINDEAVNKSGVLQNLTSHLEKLNQSFQGSGHAEITPFPQKIRDLSKYFSVNFGETETNKFSMEYHGMGTRSWASMLTVQAFTDLVSKKHEEEVEPFFPILAAEEPEAHLHPNAQKTLYQQLADYQGQVIISTHSPYVAAMAEQFEIRYLKKQPNTTVEVKKLSSQLNTKEKHKIQREIIHSRGEILFSKALVLCEGETEEQALPLLFEKYFGYNAFVLGVSFIGVNGSGEQYTPFFRFTENFAIPVFIFSDGEEDITKKLKTHYERVYGETDIFNCQNITILENTDFEGYLLSSGFRKEIESAITKLKGENAIQEWIKKHDGKPKKGGVIRNYKSSLGYDEALNDILDKDKAKFSPIVAGEICKLKRENFPPKFIEFLEKIKIGASL